MKDNKNPKRTPQISNKEIDAIVGTIHGTDWDDLASVGEQTRDFYERMIDEGKLLIAGDIDNRQKIDENVSAEQAKICRLIIEKWGIPTQINKIQEELLELALILNQQSCPTKDVKKLDKNLYGELADVKIMMMQAEIIFDRDRINEGVRNKLARVSSKYNLL